MTDRSRQLTAFVAGAGWGEAHRHPLAGDASTRRYERLTGRAGSAVLMDAASDRKGMTDFISVAEQLTEWGYSAPEILAVDLELGFMLLEDLGDGRISDLAADKSMEEKLYTLAVDFLVSLTGRPVPDDLPCFDDATLEAQGILFTEYYYPAVTGRQIPTQADRDYQNIWRELYPKMRLGRDVLVMRDFHGENLIYLPDRTGLKRLGLLDFQDALQGPVLYDLVSLLDDVRRDISPELSRQLRARYYEKTGLDGDAADAAYAALAVYRNLRIAGIFVRLSQRTDKTAYLNLLPRLWRTVDCYLQHPLLSDLQNWFAVYLPAQQRDSFLKGLAS